MVTRIQVSSFDDTFNTKIIDSENEELINYVSNKIIGIEEKFINRFSNKFNLFNNITPNSKNLENNIYNFFTDKNEDFDINQNRTLYKQLFNKELFNNFNSCQINNYINNDNRIYSNFDNNHEVNDLNKVINNNNLSTEENFNQNLEKINFLNNLIKNISITNMNLNKNNCIIKDLVEDIKHNQKISTIILDNSNILNNNPVDKLEFSYKNSIDKNALNQEIIRDLVEFLGEFFIQLDEINNLLLKVVNSNFNKNQKIKIFQNKYQELNCKYKDLLVSFELNTKYLIIRDEKIASLEQTLKYLDEQKHKNMDKIEELTFNLNLTQYELERISTNKEIQKTQENLQKRYSRRFSRSLSRDTLISPKIISLRKISNFLNEENNYLTNNLLINERQIDEQIENLENKLSFDQIEHSSNENLYINYEKGVFDYSKEHIENQRMNSFSEKENNNLLRKFSNNNQIINADLDIELELFKEEKDKLIISIENLKETIKIKDDILQKNLNENNYFITEIKKLQRDNGFSRKENDFLSYELNIIKKDNENYKRLINILKNKIYYYRKIINTNFNSKDGDFINCINKERQITENYSLTDNLHIENGDKLLIDELNKSLIEDDSQFNDLIKKRRLEKIE